jgi:hypothetical protein
VSEVSKKLIFEAARSQRWSVLWSSSGNPARLILITSSRKRGFVLNGQKTAPMKLLKLDSIYKSIRKDNPTFLTI